MMVEGILFQVILTRIIQCYQHLQLFFAHNNLLNTDSSISASQALPCNCPSLAAKSQDRTAWLSRNGSHPSIPGWLSC